jgi:hypothetical protein
MALWIEWFRCTYKLRAACSRRITFLWMALILAMMAIRPDLLGVTSFVRSSFLNPLCYHLLLNFFHSSAVALNLLLEVWVKLAMYLFHPIRVNGYIVFVADGLKIPKEGKKMPAVKSLHQESGDNLQTRAEAEEETAGTAEAVRHQGPASQLVQGLAYFLQGTKPGVRRARRDHPISRSRSSVAPGRTVGAVHPGQASHAREDHPDVQLPGSRCTDDHQAVWIALQD